MIIFLLMGIISAINIVVLFCCLQVSALSEDIDDKILEMLKKEKEINDNEEGKNN